MLAPQPGDLVVRGDAFSGVELFDAFTGIRVGGPLPNLAAAIEAAQHRGVKAVWQQMMDIRGRPLDAVFRLLYLADATPHTSGEA